MGKSSTSSLFLKVAELDESDERASKRRKLHTERSQLVAKATKSQLEMNNVLMEMRILLQRGLIAVNELNHTTENIKNDVEPVMTKLVRTRRVILEGLGRYTQDKGERGSSGDSNEAVIQEYSSCRSMWKEVLNKRQEDLLLSSGSGNTIQKKFQVIDQSLWTQVEATLAHEKLRQVEQNEGKSDDTIKNDNRLIAFDDSKVYAHMLKDFIAHRSSNISTLGADVLRLKSINKSKKQKTVDTRASKGRKLRYTVNEKLSNFTFPVSRPIPFLAEDDWFKSLFGGTSRVQQHKT